MNKCDEGLRHEMRSITLLLSITSPQPPDKESGQALSEGEGHALLRIYSFLLLIHPLIFVFFFLLFAFSFLLFAFCYLFLAFCLLPSAFSFFLPNLLF
jgi:hypothetical protein